MPTLEQATYNYPCEKQSVCKYKPHNSKDCPCALLIVIYNTNRIGNCNLLNWNDISVGIIGIHRWGHLHLSKFLLLWCWSLFFFTERRVSLQSLGWLIFRNMIKYLFNSKINGISIMKKIFKNKFLEWKEIYWTNEIWFKVY